MLRLIHIAHGDVVRRRLLGVLRLLILHVCRGRAKITRRQMLDVLHGLGVGVGRHRALLTPLVGRRDVGLEVLGLLGFGRRQVARIAIAHNVAHRQRVADAHKVIIVGQPVVGHFHLF